MSAPGANQAAVTSPLGAVPRLLAGMALLWQARASGPKTHARSGKKVVTGSALSAAGLTQADVGFLVDEGYADVTSGQVRYEAGYRPSRKFDILSESTQFVLTPTGEVFVAKFLRAFGEYRSRVDRPARRTDLRPQVILKPHWDRQRRELRFGPVLVKRFGKTAPNQERLLSAFEESGWPEDIDDPLPPGGRGSPVPRLHDTVRRLNRTLQQPLIRFERDRSGRRVTWRYVGSADNSFPAVGLEWGLLIG